jgi:hypothetical protein
MQTYYLERWLNSPIVTLGFFKDSQNKKICATLENPYLDNQTDISCIPCGTYIVQQYSSEKYPSSWEVLGVPGRTKILIHNGNTEAHTEGCILVGQKHAIFKDSVLGVTSSKDTLASLQSILPETFQLIVKVCERNTI